MKIGQIFIMSLVLVLSFSIVSAVMPSAGFITEESSERTQAGTPESDAAYAGNVTEITAVGYSITQTWQGYYGNVSGTIQLGNVDNDIMYNWTLADPEGEIYATTNDSISWSTIQCLNFSATGNEGDDTGETPGGTSQKGRNLVQLEAAFNIVSDDVDGLDETFSLTGDHEMGGNFNHTMFYSNNLQFTSGECLSTHLFDSTGSNNEDYFEEVLLYDYDSNSVIFASLLDDSVSGFDSNKHDFEMLVLEDGHGTNIATTTYYFYVELE